MANSLAQTERLAWLGWHSLPVLHIESPAFSGTLGVLILAVRENKVELKGVPLVALSRAYMDYLMAIGDTDVESAALALSALAYLVERKAAHILPRVEDEEEEDDEVISSFVLPTVEKFQPALAALIQRREERGQWFFRHGDPGGYENVVAPTGVGPDALARAFAALMAKAEPDPPPILGRPRRSMAEQIQIVWKALPLIPQSLVEIVPPPFTRSEAVWWFLALLELIRLGQASVVMDGEDVRFGQAGSMPEGVPHLG